MSVPSSPSNPDRPEQQPEGTAGSVPPGQVQPGGQGQYHPPVGAAQPLNPADDKQWGTFAHFGGVLGILPALIIYLIFKDRGRFTNQESKEALNFQITVLAVWIVVFVLSLIPLIGLLFSLVLFAIWVATVVFSILAGVSANKGQPYRYPINFRIIS